MLLVIKIMSCMVVVSIVVFIMYLVRRTECLDTEVCASGFTREMQQLLDQEVKSLCVQLHTSL